MNTDDILNHHGIKGMRWGVRKDRVTIRERVDSLKRERQWKKVLGEADNLTNEQMNTVGKRIKLENDLKRLVKESKMAKKSDKKDYIQRGQMDDAELKSKVDRLQAKDNLSKSVDAATKEQREFGEKIVNTGSTLALSYVTNQKITGKDIFDAIQSPKKDARSQVESKIKDKAVRKILDSIKQPNQ